MKMKDMPRFKNVSNHSIAKHHKHTQKIRSAPKRRQGKAFNALAFTPSLA